MQATPWSSAISTPMMIAPSNASQADPVTTATQAAANAAASILPSRPMSMVPERSENMPAMAHNTSGVAMRSVAERIETAWSQRSMSGGLRQDRAPVQHQVKPRDPRPVHVGKRTGEHDDQALHRHDHVAVDGGNLEREFGAALIERAEQKSRELDADRMIAPHQRHRDAGETGAGDEIQQHVVVVADDLVERDAGRQRAGQAHRDHDDAPRRDAGIDRRLRRQADRADRIAPARTPDEDPDEHATDRRPDDRQ